jgi:hypothetical protein
MIFLYLSNRNFSAKCLTSKCCVQIYLIEHIWFRQRWRKNFWVSFVWISLDFNPNRKPTELSDLFFSLLNSNLCFSFEEIQKIVESTCRFFRNKIFKSLKHKNLSKLNNNKKSIKQSISSGFYFEFLLFSRITKWFTTKQ